MSIFHEPTSGPTTVSFWPFFSLVFRHSRLCALVWFSVDLEYYCCFVCSCLVFFFMQIFILCVVCCNLFLIMFVFDKFVLFFLFAIFSCKIWWYCELHWGEVCFVDWVSTYYMSLLNSCLEVRLRYILPMNYYYRKNGHHNVDSYVQIKAYQDLQ